MSQHTLVQKCKSVNILISIFTKEQSPIRKNILKTPLYTPMSSNGTILYAKATSLAMHGFQTSVFLNLFFPEHNFNLFKNLSNMILQRKYISKYYDERTSFSDLFS